MRNESLKISAIQMNSKPDLEANLASAQKLTARSAELGAEVVVLPEYFALIDEPKKQAAAAGRVYERGVKFLSETAKEYGVYLIGGGLPLPCEEHSVYEGINKSYNVSFVFNPQGEEIARNSKIHLFKITRAIGEAHSENDIFVNGSETCNIEIKGFNFGLSICNDIRYPELFLRLSKGGAEVVIVTAAFTVPTGKLHWEMLTRTRAVETQCYLLAAAQAGEHFPGRTTFGRSVIIDPLGRKLEELGGEGEGVIVEEIKKSELKAAREMLPVLANRRLTP